MKFSIQNDLTFMNPDIVLKDSILLIVSASFIPETYQIPEKLQKFAVNHPNIDIVFMFNEPLLNLSQTVCKNSQFNNIIIASDQYNKYFDAILREINLRLLPALILFQQDELIWNGSIQELDFGVRNIQDKQSK